MGRERKVTDTGQIEALYPCFGGGRSEIQAFFRSVKRRRDGPEFISCLWQWRKLAHLAYVGDRSPRENARKAYAPRCASTPFEQRITKAGKALCTRIPASESP